MKNSTAKGYCPGSGGGTTTQETVVAAREVIYLGRCPHCQQWLPLTQLERWPDGFTYRLPAHEPEERSDGR